MSETMIQVGKKKSFPVQPRVAPTYKDIEILVDVFKDKISAVEKNTVAVAWELGEQIDLIASKGLYGPSAMDKLGEGLGKSVSSLYKYRQFYQRIPWDDVETLLLDIPFRLVTQVMSLPEAQQEALFESARNGGLTQDKWADAVAEAKEEKKQKDTERKEQKEREMDPAKAAARASKAAGGKLLGKVDALLETGHDLVAVIVNGADEVAGDPACHTEVEQEMTALVRQLNQLPEMVSILTGDIHAVYPTSGSPMGPRKKKA